MFYRRVVNHSSLDRLSNSITAKALTCPIPHPTMPVFETSNAQFRVMLMLPTNSHFGKCVILFRSRGFCLEEEKTKLAYLPNRGLAECCLRQKINLIGQLPSLRFAQFRPVPSSASPIWAHSSDARNDGRGYQTGLVSLLG